MRSRFIDEIPQELTDQAARAAAGLPTGRVASWAGAAAASAEARPRRATPARPGVPDGRRRRPRRFGEGVVTGTEPGGIVVVRFASDGSERKLMADYAPIRRR